MGAFYGSDAASPRWGGRVFFAQSTEPSANLFWNTLSDTARNYHLPADWASVRPVQLTYKINHHSMIGGSKLAVLPTPDLRGGKKGWKLGRSPKANDLIDRAYITKPP